MPDELHGSFGSWREEDPLAFAAAILARHHMSAGELRAALESRGAADPDSLIRELIRSGRATLVERGGATFLRWSDAAT